MPTSDLDMPLLPSAEQIRRREFATVRRGYDPEQVRGYLTSIASQVETLERELSQLQLEAGSAAARQAVPQMVVEPAAPPASDPYETLSKRFATLIAMADQEAERIVGDARAEAARALEQARAEADRIKVDAQAHAEEARQESTELLERARVESERELSGLTDRRRKLVSQLEEMRSTLIAVTDELTAPLDEAIQNDAEDAGFDGIGGGPGPGAPDPVDPRYEDLWVSAETSVELPDLASIDLDFDDDDE